MRATATTSEADSARISEVEFEREASHDVIASVQICELAASGEYLPVPLVANTPLDPGAFFLRQGLQRRLVLSLTHGSGQAWRWTRIQNVQLGQVRLLDSKGLVHASPSRESIDLRPMRRQPADFETDGSAKLGFTASWDSSAHDSLFLDRPTQAQTRALLKLSWTVDMPQASPVTFSALTLEKSR